MNIAIIYNWTICGYLMLISILAVNGNLAYGQGLGDLYYLIVSGIFALIQLTIIKSIQSKQNGFTNQKRLYVVGTFFLLTALLLTWKFTVGRGPEYNWNGNIFYRNPF